MDKPVAVKRSRNKPGGNTSPAATPALVRGVKVTHGERVIDETTGITKAELVAYYDKVASVMLPHLAARPVSLVRAPEGIGGATFFFKHGEGKSLPLLKQLDPSLDPDHPPLIAIESAEALISVAQLNTIELHTWNARYKRIEQPDRLVFDLDPGEGVVWAQLRDAADRTHALLDQLGLTSFVKTSGGKGLHIVVPITPRLSWDEVKDFSHAVVERLAKGLPALVVAKSGPRNRVGRIFIDYVRNGRGSTTAAAFSARARPGLGVSVPIAWDELAWLDSASHWTIRNVDERLGSGIDPWAAYPETRQTLAAAIKQMAAAAS